MVDDGIATGGMAVRRWRWPGPTACPASCSVLVPVAPPDAVASMRTVADAVVCLVSPEPFSAVGHWYEDFTQTSDAEVVRLLEAHRHRGDP